MHPAGSHYSHPKVGFSGTSGLFSNLCQATAHQMLASAPCQHQITKQLIFLKSQNKNRATSLIFPFLSPMSRFLAELQDMEIMDGSAQGVFIASSFLAKQQLLRATKWLGKVAAGSMLRNIAFP